MPTQQPMALTQEQLEQMSPSSLLLTAEVAAIFRVDPKTVTRWSQAGKLAAIRTLGGHRRFRVGVVLQKLRKDEGS